MKYTVPSASVEGMFYNVINSPSVTRCECRWYKEQSSPCRHINLTAEAVKNSLSLPLGTFAPMLAKPYEPKYGIKPGAGLTWFVEEKYDGHRMLVRVTPSGFTTWSRQGNDSLRKLNTELQLAIKALPVGIYDGELVTQGVSSNATVASLSERSKMQFVIFDILEIDNIAVIMLPYAARRTLLQGALKDCKNGLLRPSQVWPVDTQEQLDDVVNQIWSRSGEGVIVKNPALPYSIGKRSWAFMKLKQLQSAVLTITGWKPGTTGPYCVALLEDSKGNLCKVKALDDLTRARILEEHETMIGRELRIEYSTRTPDGAYLNPRWDRFEDE